jgi:hypothetical protein
MLTVKFNLLNFTVGFVCFIIKPIKYTEIYTSAFQTLNTLYVYIFFFYVPEENLLQFFRVLYCLFFSQNSFLRKVKIFCVFLIQYDYITR